MIHCEYFSHLISPQVALAESDCRGEELESHNRLLEGQVAELEEKVSVKERAEEGVRLDLAERGRQWEVRRGGEGR